MVQPSSLMVKSRVAMASWAQVRQLCGEWQHLDPPGGAGVAPQRAHRPYTGPGCGENSLAFMIFRLMVIGVNGQ
jgi:hypothetical protein